ncbi:MAG: bifunctional phosphoglucose/phosphomannose isomerase [Bacteroidia bacterium]
MEDLIANFTDQLREALEIGGKAQLRQSEKQINNIIITGLGGSGIGGTIVSEIVANEIKVPIVINKDYFLPAFASENTLVIACSYSGNTEETLQAFETALKKKCTIVCITSGGKLIELAEKNNLDYIKIPGGMPPRACLGYSLPQLFFVLHKLGFISNSFISEIEKAIKLLDAEEEDIRTKAKAIAGALFNNLPIIYSVAGYEGVAVRFRQQLNENSKVLAWHHVLPEMNHNELVGWTQENDELAVVILRNEDDYERSVKRIEISKEVFQKYTPNILEIYSKGNSRIERSLYLIHLCDWVTAEIANLRGIDAVEVRVIDYLKGSLAKA